MTEFETAYKKYRGDMVRAARRMGLAWNEAEECAQEAARKLSRMVTLSYTDQSKLKAFFCEASRNVAKDRVKSRDLFEAVNTDPAIVGAIHVVPPKMDKKITIGMDVHKAL